MKIEKMYAFVSEDEEKGGDEGVMAFMDPNSKSWHPMVGADLNRVKDLIPIADRMCEGTNRSYKILIFENRRDVTKEVQNDS